MTEDKKEKILVTSALPYANGPIHFGHIAGAYLPADIYVRYKKMTGADIKYICGTDDHGVAITISAEAAGRTPAEHVKINHDLIKTIFDKMNIDFTFFSQTSNGMNHKMSQHFFTRCVDNGLLEAKETEQYYCTKCDRFLADRYLSGSCPHCGHEGARGDECGGCGKYLDASEVKNPMCKVCGEKPEIRSTTNWFIKLSEQQEWLKDWLDAKYEGKKWAFPEITEQELEKDPEAIPKWKKIVIQEINGYLKRGLIDRAITRDMEWGVALPEPYTQDGKVLYVWFDAPVGYVSFTREYFEQQGSPDEWKDYWRNPEGCKLVHFIGKDNIVFHAMIFPIMMKGVDENYNMPHFVSGNAFLNLEGRQFSKSEGWYIDVLEFFKDYPETDSIRYYLCSDMPEETDADFLWDRFQQAHNKELTSIYANLVNRTLKFISTKLDGKVPAADYKAFSDPEKVHAKGSPDDSYYYVGLELEQGAATVGDHLSKFQFRFALQKVLGIARAGNQFFDSQAPWKSLTENRAKCDHDIHICLRLLKSLAVVSAPFIPETAQRVWEQLGFTGNVSDVKWLDAATDTFKDGEPLPEPEALFKKIDDKQIAKEKNKLAELRNALDTKNGKGEKKEQELPGIRKAVDFKDFSRMDMRVGKILEAENVQGSHKLLKLKVDIGIEERQIVAGIAKFYKPEDLVGRLVVVMANLEPKPLMGLESQGMVLAAGPSDNIVLLSPIGDIPPGNRVS